ncbi:heparinase II/III domain-containing protein [Chania multitudinisentens]|uniref:heparinase II/III domain-containing protein n=1 Tax=Chania multitudinisentens TaxID=1639108 RepID=UPI0003E13806|nr:heparinase II/III family protein [Chania multitudinisentens]
MNSILPLANSQQWLSLANCDDPRLKSELVIIRSNLRDARQAGVNVPGQGEAGSLEHNQHQKNSRLIEQAGLLWQIEADREAAQFGIQLLQKYAEGYQAMPFHQQKNTNPPGKLFHQLLNEHMWLLYASLGYGYLKSSLSIEQQQQIEQGLFQPMLTLFCETYAHDFDRIHNHGLWAVAAVGICGIVLELPHYVDCAIYGLAGDSRQGGYLAQIDRLFSPSGYYLEGPYYQRFAIRPLYLFAEALHQHRPALEIYQYAQQRIARTTEALLQTAYPDGRFPALNDASRSMNTEDEGVLIATQLYRLRYGEHALIERCYRQQQRCWPYPAAPLSDTVFAGCYESVELTEGEQGDAGAQGILRALAANGEVTQVMMAYGQHGMGHGHFDTLGITLYAQGREVLREYGFARWVNVESKFGGRYLPENQSYARQTVAHNTVTVDQCSQNQANAALADRVHGRRHFFIATKEVEQGATLTAMSAFANQHYPGVDMQRTVLLLTLAEHSAPLLIDLYRLQALQPHQYDYSLHYQGQIVATSLDYQRESCWSPLGETSGYQHLLLTAQSAVTQPFSITWLQGAHFTSWHSAASGGEVLFTYTGGDDPQFNLRNEPGLILRQHAAGDHLFASVFESHGYFDEASEQCYDACGKVQQLRVVGHNLEGSVLEMTLEQQRWQLMISNQPNLTAVTENQLEFNGNSFRWQGFIAIRRIA